MTELATFFTDTRLTELGKIKIGGKGETRKTRAGGEWRLPKKYDHFIVTTLQRSPAGDLVEDASLMEQLIAKHGDPEDHRLRELPIRVLSNEIEDIMQCAYVWYGGRTVGARSDGKTVTWFNDRQSGKAMPEPLVEDWKPEYMELTNNKGAKLFKLHTVFNCVIAAAEAKWGGVYRFRTTSVISSKQLYQSLLHLHQLTGGILIGMPLMMVVRPMQVSPGGKATTVYVVHVELRGPDLQQLQLQALDVARVQLANRQKVRAINGEYRRLLLPPGHEYDGDAKDINEEFQPETVEDEIEAVAPPPKDVFWTDVMDGKEAPVEQPTEEPAPVEAPPSELPPSACMPEERVDEPEKPPAMKQNPKLPQAPPGDPNDLLPY